MTQISIQTTQNVNVHYKIADLGDRILGRLIDWAICILYFLAILYFAPNLINFNSGGFNAENIWYFEKLIFLPIGFYTILCETFMNGQTFGKKVVKTKVIRLDGRQPTIGNYFLRWFILGFDSFFFFIGLLCIAFSARSQRLGDLMAGTTIVKIGKRTKLSDTIFVDLEDDYEPVFSNAQILKLSDADVTIIKKVLEESIQSRNYLNIDTLAEKTEEVMGIQTDMDSIRFLKTILKDYNHLIEDPVIAFSRKPER